MDVKKLLGNQALPGFIDLIYELDSEGKGVKITNKDKHKIFNVLTDSETILINSENELYLPIDNVTIYVDSESKLLKAAGLDVKDGEAIKIRNSEENGLTVKYINVLYDSESVVLNSEGELYVPFDKRTIVVDSEGHISLPIDEKTIFVDSEDGLLKSKGLIVSEGQAIRIENSELDGVSQAIINVKYDSETIILDSDGNLTVPLDYRTIIVNSEDKIAVPIDELTIVVNSEGKLSVALEDGEATEVADSEGKIQVNVLRDEKTIFLTSENTLEIRPDEERAFTVDSEGKLFVKVDGLTIQYNSDGELVSFPEPLFDGVATHVVYGTSEWDSESIDVLFNSEMGLGVDSENQLYVKVDNISVKFNSEGELYVIPEPLFDGVATKVNPKTAEYDSESIDVLFNSEAGLQVNSENELEVKIQEPLFFNSEGKIELKYDERTLVVDPNTKELLVPIDDDTIRVNSEGKLEADSLPKPVLPETFLHVDSEGTVEWREQRLNDQEFIGDLNTETAKIIWYGTSEEYEQLVANSELYDYTLYVINDGAPIVSQDFNYNELTNKPEINGVVLSGNKTFADFGIQPVLNSGVAVNINNNRTDLQYLPGVLGVDSSNRLYANTYTADQIDNMLASLRTIKYADVKPSAGQRNTLYYIGTAEPYEIYLYDSYGTEIYLGTSSVRTYSAGEGININSSNVISADLETDLSHNTVSTKAPTSVSVVNYAEAKDNKVTAINASSTDEQYPSAKLVYDKLEEKVGSIAPSDSSLEILGGTTLTHKTPADLGGAATIGSATLIPKITYDRFGHIQKAEGVTVYPPTTPGLNGQLWISDGAEAGVWAGLNSLVRVKYQTGEQANVTDSTTLVVSAPAADAGYARIGCVGAYISSTVPGVNWAVTNMTDSQVTLYANGWTGAQTITANTVWLYVRSNG